MDLRTWLPRAVPFSFLLVCLSAATTSAAPVLVLLNGRIATAEGVVVDGKTYDVDFLDGFCTDVFSGCDASTAFAFDTAPEAEAASQALLDTVLLDFGTLETLFDFRWELTNGCESVGAAPFSDCRIITPYSVESAVFDVTTGETHNVLLGGLAINTNNADGVKHYAIDVTAFPDGKTASQSSFSPTENFTWARWRLRSDDTTGDGDTTGTVPEPATAMLLGLGLLFRGVRRRRPR